MTVSNEAAGSIKIPEYPTTFHMRSEDGRELLRIEPDGTVVGAVEDASEAGRVFVASIRYMLSVAHTSSLIQAQALEDAADAFENLPINKGPEISSGTWEWFELFPLEHLRARAAALRGQA